MDHHASHINTALGLVKKGKDALYHYNEAAGDASNRRHYGANNSVNPTIIQQQQLLRQNQVLTGPERVGTKWLNWRNVGGRRRRKNNKRKLYTKKRRMRSTNKRKTSRRKFKKTKQRRKT